MEERSWPVGIDHRDAFDAMLDSVTILSSVRDDEGRIVDFRFEYLNAAAVSAFVDLGGNLAGQHVSSVFPTATESGLVDRLRTMVESGTPLSMEVPWADPVRGESTWEVSASPLGDGFMTVVRDLTERTRLLLESRERELRYRLLADHAGDVATLSQNGVVQWVGPSVTDLLGWQPDELIGTEVWALVHPDDLERLRTFRGGLDRKGPQRVRVRMRHKSGSYRWVENSSRLASEEGLIGAVVSVMWSVDAEVEALAALQRAEAERAVMERRMQQAQRLESLGVLAGGIAHDFNNLLVGVLGNAQLAREHADQPDTLRDLLDQLIVAGERAADLTRQMLDYAGQRSVAPVPVDLGALVADTVGMLRPTLAAGTDVRVLLDEDLPCVVADATQLRQVVMNLVINASDSHDGDPGVVTVRVSTRSLDAAQVAALAPLNPPRAGSFVVLEISDTGRGMSDETMSKMFEPFFTTGTTGRGLGLSVVHGAVRSLGGAIEATSEPGVGTTMRVYLPADDGTPRLATADAPVAAAPVTARPVAGTVLVVDDEAVVSAMIRRVLESADHPVLVASSAQAGLEEFARCPEDFAVALVDITMPGMSGIEMSAALHAIRPDLPIVLMSGYTADDIGMELTDPRFSFLAKPFRLDTLLDAVSNAGARGTA